MPRIAGQPSERLEFLLHEKARISRQITCDAGGRSVRAVRGAERVVNVDLGERGEVPREERIVFLLFGVETQVLEHHDVAVLHGGDGLFG
jgi:hypothetical protein